MVLALWCLANQLEVHRRVLDQPRPRIPMISEKLCSKCGQLGKFGPDRRARDGLQSSCLECYRQFDRQRYRENRERNRNVRTRAKQYWQSLPEHVRRARGRANFLRNNHGITPGDFDAMMKQQGGVCAICSRPPSGKTRRTSVLQVDHDHDTGKIRGLLCDTCNTALGRLGDNAEGIRRVLEYLLRSESEQ